MTDTKPPSSEPLTRFAVNLKTTCFFTLLQRKTLQEEDRLENSNWTFCRRKISERSSDLPATSPAKPNMKISTSRRHPQNHLATKINTARLTGKTENKQSFYTTKFSQSRQRRAGRRRKTQRYYFFLFSLFFFLFQFVILVLKIVFVETCYDFNFFFKRTVITQNEYVAKRICRIVNKK